MTAPRRRRRLIGSAIAAVLLVFVGVNGYTHSLDHVRYMAGTESPDLNCFACHVATQPDGPFARFYQEDYLSPLDVEVSEDGSRLYVTAEDADLLLVVDPEQREVVRSISVGSRPHSVAATGDGSTAYVTNRWSNTVSIVDLTEGVVTGEIPVGTGPSGLVLSPDESTLYVANTTSDNVSSRFARPRVSGTLDRSCSIPVWLTSFPDRPRF